MTEDQKNYFDDYADNYSKLVDDQAGIFAQGHDYFSWHKTEILKRVWGAERPGPFKILEFGCGIGLNLPHIKNGFPNSEIYATDISEKSLTTVQKTIKNVICLPDSDLGGMQFDLILIACVFHHIVPDERDAVFERLSQLLTPQGMICVVEHNPYNPVTRHMVNTCPFDEDAILLTMNETKKRIARNQHLKLSKSAYCLFFPEKLKALNRIEFMVGSVPLGGQYFVSAVKV